MAKDMSINELAGLVSHSFSEQKKYLDTKFFEIDQKFAHHDEKFTDHDEKFDRIFATLENHTVILDRHTHILDRLDQERLFTLEHVRRLEHEIKRIKTRLKIV